MSVLSLIVARKGSKGLKNKVLRKINDKYIFEYSINYSLALSSKIGSEVLTAVSSDSEIIEKYCIGNNIMFTPRKPELAMDDTPIEKVMYETYKKIGMNFKYISLLYGNIPTRYNDEFLKAFQFLEENPSYDAVLSMQNVEKHNPAWMFELDENILPLKNEEGFRRQDLKQLMIHDGHTVLVRTRYFVDFMENQKPQGILFEGFGKRIKPMLNTKPLIDIDTEKDLKLAEAILSNTN